MTDPISDMLIRLENAQAVDKKTVDLPFSEIKYKIAKVFESEGFIESAIKKGRNPQKIIRVNLKYQDQVGAITKTRRVSKPGNRVYVGYKDIRQVRGGYGISVVSTPKGIMSNKEARNAEVGGELLCEIW